MAAPGTAVLALAAAGLSGFAVVLLLVVLWRQRGSDVPTGDLATAVDRALAEAQFQDHVVRLEQHAEEVREMHTDLENMLRQPRERGAFGERQLEVLLSDHLPPERYGVREQVVDGKTPDAHVRSSAGVIPIDSKFPIENYEAYVEATDEERREQYRKQFRRNVRSQLEKIRTDYVRPDAGTTNFAFAFIPSEGVYHHLITEEYDLLAGYAREGVHAVSPLTLGHKLELVRADIHAHKLSSEAGEVLERLQALANRFEAIEDDWSTMRQHVRNAENKAVDVDQQFRALHEEFERTASGRIEAGRGRGD